MQSLSRRELERLYPTTLDEIRVYVASLEESDDPSYHLLAPVGAPVYPAIVIDSADVGDSCGPAAEPCRLLSQALGEALAMYAGDAVLKDAGIRMADHARSHANQQFVTIKSVKPILKSAPTPHRGSGNVPFLVKDIHPTQSSAPFYLTKVGSRLFFGADDGVHGDELWVSDGTETGTYMVMDTLPGSGSGGTGRIREMGGRAYYHAADGSGDYDLWVTDGTPGQATFIIRVADFENVEMEPLGSLILFEKEGSPSGNTDLWRTEGTSQSTILVKNIRVNNMSEASGPLLYMAAIGLGTTVPGYDAWKTDGTTAGTTLLADLRGAIWMTEFNGGAVFQGDLAEDGIEPWFTDGTPEGTVMLKDIFPGGPSSAPNCFGVFNGHVYFNATSPTVGREPWRTDGTPQGTELFADINPNGHAGGCDFTDVNGTLFFTAYQDDTGRELWKSDGTQQGTVLVKDIYPGAEHSGIENLVSSSGKLYFRADDGIHGFELWVSDGTDQGTYMVADIKAGAGIGVGVEPMMDVDGVLYFVGQGDTFAELWAQDNTFDPIPTTSSWGILCLGIVLLAAGSIVLRPRVSGK